MTRFTALLALALLAVSPASAIWPLPTDIKTGTSTLTLAPSFHIALSIHDPPADLAAAVARTTQHIKTDKHARMVPGRGASDVSSFAKAHSLPSLTVQLAPGVKSVKSISSDAIAPVEKRDESYSLTVPADGKPAVLSAKSALGLFRGLTTFEQMWYTHGDKIYALEAPYTITDSPAYPYRGLHLDTARNYFPVADIKRTLDTMSWVKINQFHWHVVDSQSFPLVVPGFTELAEKGAYSSAQTYSPADVADITAYAAARGIDVLAEIDTPGHTAVIAEAHPEHIACAQATPWASFANEPPAGQLRLAAPETIKFTANLLTAAAKLFPSSYFSTGGDEINANCYAKDEPTQAALNKTGQTFEQALSDFTVASHKALAKVGKTPVVWEEMVLDHNVTLSDSTIVLVWISSANVKAVAESGKRLVHAASDYFYLDCGAGGWVGSFPEGNSWCEPFKTWQRAYTFDPTANLTAEEAKLVLGGQHLLWTEQSGPENVDPTVWPRAAASAELFWTGPEKTNDTLALPRLHDLAYRMRQRGTKAISLQPEWCALRPGACDLTA